MSELTYSNLPWPWIYGCRTCGWTAPGRFEPYVPGREPPCKKDRKHGPIEYLSQDGGR